MVHSRARRDNIFQVQFARIVLAFQAPPQAVIPSTIASATKEQNPPPDVMAGLAESVPPANTKARPVPKHARPVRRANMDRVKANGTVTLACHAQVVRLGHTETGAAEARREAAQAARQASTSHRRDPGRVRPVEAARLEHIVKGAAAARREAAQAALQASTSHRRGPRRAQLVEAARLEHIVKGAAAARREAAQHAQSESINPVQDRRDARIVRAARLGRTGTDAALEQAPAGFNRALSYTMCQPDATVSS
jgi:hypothetical protein